MVNIRKHEEYGGFLPLELNPGTEYFSRYGDYLFRYNSVKAAIDEIIKILGCGKVFVPYYYCPSTTEAIRNTGVEVNFYHIDESLMPIDLPDESGSIIILVDYFGVCEKKIKRIGESIKNAEVIFDFAHDFFAEPIIDKKRHNVYSAKKFFGVPDGSYLLSEAMIPRMKSFTHSSGYAEYLLQTYELGTNLSYNMKKNVDNYLSKNYGNMSILTRGLLGNVDYTRVMTQRMNNYNTLKRALCSINSLKLLESCIAYQYPLLIKYEGRTIKRKLIEKKIFVSTLWSGDELKTEGNEFELFMMHDCVFLPVDQRYDGVDMEYISNCIMEMSED